MFDNNLTWVYQEQNCQEWNIADPWLHYNIFF